MTATWNASLDKQVDIIQGHPVLARLQRDHRSMARVLDVLEAQRNLLGTDEGADYMVMEQALAYLSVYADGVHHPLEDRVFDQILDKGLTPPERALVLGNLNQHVEICEATDKARADMTLILNDVVIPMQKLADDLDAYVKLQKLHMRIEQTQIFPLAVRTLKASDWEQAANDFRTPDPLTEGAPENLDLAALNAYLAEGG